MALIWNHPTASLVGTSCFYPVAVNDSRQKNLAFAEIRLGKMFEGSPTTMLRSLERVSTLSEDTLIWPGHEYAQENLNFAATVDASNSSLLEKKAWVLERRENQLPTVMNLSKNNWPLFTLQNHIFGAWKTCRLS